MQKRSMEDKIKLLERQLAEKEFLIEQLTSKLDQYQSVMRIPSLPASICSLTAADMSGSGRPRKLRALGISAEPQNVPRTLEEFNKDAFQTHPKAAR